MTIGNGRILAKSIEFGEPKFRKLGGLKIEFASRVTLIAGHNGIGKSTILGLLTNTFGITSAEPKNYFGEAFFKNIERIVYLAPPEAAYAKTHPTSAPVVTAAAGDLVIPKRSAVTPRTKWNRARVVPRTVERSEDDPVGPDAKIPHPTIYLGMRRLASIGEADDETITSALLNMHPDDRRLMAEFVKSVILGIAVNENVTQTPVKGAGKISVQPGFDAHDAMAISVGQDSLGSIAAAFASFNRLKRDMGDDYQGGLLVIDELDVGFHPHALERLAGAIKNQAKRLDVQVIATTHSPSLIECIHPEGGGDNKSPDSVIYLLDTNTPRIAEDQSLAAILEDMSLRQDIPKPVAKPKLGVYFEDEEARQLFDAFVTRGVKTSISRRLGVTIKPLALGIGGSNLLALPDHDPIFKDRILIVDADTAIPNKAKKRGNAVKLPCPVKAAGTARSPENMIINFLKAMMDANDGPYYNLMLALKVKNPSSDKIRQAFFGDLNLKLSDRESTKKWWIKHWNTLEKWGVLELWARHHAAEVTAFLKDFEAAVVRTSTRLR